MCIRDRGRAFQLTNLFPNLPVLENVRLAVQAAHDGPHRRGLNLWSIWSDHAALTQRAHEILAAVAEYEARLISERTKAGLASARARGVRLGKPENLARGNHAAARLHASRAQAVAVRMRPVIEALRDSGVRSATGIAAQLNQRGYVTDRGCGWHSATVVRLLRRLTAAPSTTEHARF